MSGERLYRRSLAEIGREEKLADLEIARHEERLRQIFTTHSVVLAYLFGSQAEGKAGPLSDVDIAVLLGPHVARERWFQAQLDLIGELMSLFHRNDVYVDTEPLRRLQDRRLLERVEEYRATSLPSTR